MTGVIYGGDYDYIKDYTEPNSGTAEAEAKAYKAALDKNYLRTGSVTVTVSAPQGGVSTLTIEINGQKTYEQADFDQIASITNLRLQSHWGSGVVFYNFDIDE